MTKKELERLHSDKVQIEKAPSKNNTYQRTKYIVYMSLTLGELLALKNALETNPTLVGSDVRDYVNNAIEKAGVNDPNGMSF